MRLPCSRFKIIEGAQTIPDLPVKCYHYPPQGPCCCPSQQSSRRGRRPFSTASRNGITSEVASPDWRCSHSEVASLQREVSELRQLVAAQGKLVKDQVHFQRSLFH